MNMIKQSGDPDPRTRESLIDEHDLVGGFVAAVRNAQSGRSVRSFAGPTLASSDVAEISMRASLNGVDVATRTGVDSARRLAEAVRHGSVADRRTAHIAIAEIIHTLVEPYDGRVVSQPRAFAMVSQVEDQLQRLRSKAPRLRWTASLARTWTAVGCALSLVAAVEIVDGRFFLAAALLSARILVSLTMTTPGFASDTRSRVARSVDWRACVVGQVTDAAVLSALSGYLLVNGERGWGLLTSMVPLVCLGATLLRLAAAQGGVVLGRLHVERVARNGVLIGGLLFAGLMGHFARGIQVLPVLLASSGAAAYAIGESVRTLVYSANRQSLDLLDGAHEAFAKRVANVVPLVDAVVGAVNRVRSNGSAA